MFFKLILIFTGKPVVNVYLSSQGSLGAGIKYFVCTIAQWDPAKPASDQCEVGCIGTGTEWALSREEAQRMKTVRTASCQVRQSVCDPMSTSDVPSARIYNSCPQSCPLS